MILKMKRWSRIANFCALQIVSPLLQEEAAVSLSIEPHSLSSENDSQPTPPPRKKKLKKKLEQLIEREVNQKNFVENAFPDSNVSDPTVKNDLSGENSADIDDKLTETAAEGTLSTVEQVSPKKSRRRKKHLR